MTGTNRTTQSQDELQIRQLMAEWEAAMHGRDAERIVARYAPEIVKFDLAPPLRQLAPEALDVERVRRWLSGFDGPIEYEIRDLSVTAGDEIAFCHSLNRLSATPHGSPQAFNLWFRATLGLRKIGGAWRVVHQHLSTPFYMDGSFKAAVDLQP
jgi:ketosteroid isomerase-like protein